MLDASLLQAHCFLVDAVRSDIGADWAALVDGGGRVLMARLPPGVSPAPSRPAAWRAAGEHLALVTSDDGSTLAVGRRGSPFEHDERVRLNNLAAEAGWLKGGRPGNT